MTRVGLLADVHANVPALEAGLHVMADEGVDMVACAGDLVGYGPDPDRAVDMVMRNCDVVVAGNHDLMALGALGTDRCIPVARVTMDWTRSTIADSTRSALASLPMEACFGRVVVTHGGLGDPQRYVLSPADHQAELDRLADRHPEARLLVVGHTHRVALVGEGPDAVALGPGGAAAPLDEGRTYVLNPGSIGQSRERRPLTTLAILDDERHVRVIPIVVERTLLERRLTARGLPADALHLRPTLASRARRSLMHYARALRGRPSTSS
jgi:predicted phosphodiesterase